MGNLRQLTSKAENCTLISHISDRLETQRMQQLQYQVAYDLCNEKNKKKEKKRGGMGEVVGLEG